MSETLGLMLVRADKITRAQLYEALRDQRATGKRLGDILYERGWIGEDDVAMLIAKQLDLPFIDSDSLERLPPGIADRIPKKVAQEYRVVPVKLLKGKITLAMEDQRTRNYMDELSYLIGTTCVPALASPKAVRATLKRFYGIEVQDAVAKKGASASDPLDPDDTAEVRPAEKLEALPVARTDASGRAVAAMRNAKGEEQVYLLTEVAPVDAEAVQNDDPTVKIRAAKPASRPAARPSPEDDGATRILPRAQKPAAKPAVSPAPTPAAPKPATGDEESHDNFLAPDLQDDRPLFTPKVVSGAPARKPAVAAPALPAPATAPAPSSAPPAPAGSASAASEGEFDIVHAAEHLFECTTVAQIGEIIVRFARHLVERAMFFELDERCFRCSATTDGLELESRGKEYALEDLVLLGVIAQNKQPAYGPTPAGEMYERFFDTLGMMRPPVILLYPLSVAGQARAVLYAGLAAPRPPEEFGDLQLLFKEAATALEILAG